MNFLSALDSNLFLLLNSITGYSAQTDFVIVFFASYLAFVLFVILVFILYRSPYPIREKLTILSVALISSGISRFGITELIRYVYHHPRPFLVYHIQPLFSETSYSFPSAHAAFFFAFAGSLYAYNKRWGIWFFVATLCMTIARIVAGVHYPSDILGGMILGLTVSYIVSVCVKRLARNSQ